eukprot:scaffold70743_cov60-Phaeocystis_antarctica.AAC.4
MSSLRLAWSLSPCSRGLESVAPILSRGVLVPCRQETEQALGRPPPSTIVGCPVGNHVVHLPTLVSHATADTPRVDQAASGQLRQRSRHSTETRVSRERR